MIKIIQALKPFEVKHIRNVYCMTINEKFSHERIEAEININLETKSFNKL